MRAIYYRIKQPQSVPMYDDIRDSYHLLIGEEMIEVPSALFKKLFEEVDREQVFDEPIQRMKQLSPNTIKFILQSMTDSSDPKAKETYEETKEMLRSIKKMGIDRQLLRNTISSILIQNEMQASIDEFAKLADRIYDELEKESGA